MFGFNNDIAIDLGTATTLVYVRGKGIVIREPSVVAFDTNTGKTIAIGSEAAKMLGRTPAHIQAVRPMCDGVISDYLLTEEMIRYYIKKICGQMRTIKPRVMVCVPSITTDVEARAIVEAAASAGARRVYLIEEPVAAAIGMNIDISRPHGVMITDIGGGTTDIAVISLGGVSVSNSVKVAGNKFDEAIARYIRRKYSVVVGDQTAEKIKLQIGCAWPKEEMTYMDAKGLNVITGLPQIVNISSEEMREALAEPIMLIANTVHNVLENTPPELIADISQDGILLTGGGALLDGLDQYLSKRTGIKVVIAEDAADCVVLGIGKALEYSSLTEGAKLFRGNLYE